MIDVTWNEIIKYLSKFMFIRCKTLTCKLMCIFYVYDFTFLFRSVFLFDVEMIDVTWNEVVSLFAILNIISSMPRFFQALTKCRADFYTFFLPNVAFS